MDIDFHKLLEWIVGRGVELSSDEKSIKFEIKRDLTKKEYKVLLHMFGGGSETEIMEQLNLDKERFDKVLKSAKSKIKSNLGKFAQLNSDKVL